MYARRRSSRSTIRRRSTTRRSRAPIRRLASRSRPRRRTLTYRRRGRR